MATKQSMAHDACGVSQGCGMLRNAWDMWDMWSEMMSKPVYAIRRGGRRDVGRGTTARARPA